MTQETVYKTQEAAVSKRGAALPAYALIAVGSVLLLAMMFDVHLLAFTWPALIIGIGLLFMRPAYTATPAQQSKWVFLAIPGAMIAALGALLFLMNLTGHFEAMAYSWPLIIAAAAGGVMYATRHDENPTLEERGARFVRAMIMVFLGLAFFFEILIFENFNPLMALGTIALGLYLLMRERRAGKGA